MEERKELELEEKYYAENYAEDFLQKKINKTYFPLKGKEFQDVFKKAKLYEDESAKYMLFRAHLYFIQEEVKETDEDFEWVLQEYICNLKDAIDASMSLVSPTLTTFRKFIKSELRGESVTGAEQTVRGTLTEHSALPLLFKDEQCAPIPEEERKRVILLAQQGDCMAQDRLLLSFSRMMWTLARKKQYWTFIKKSKKKKEDKEQNMVEEEIRIPLTSSTHEIFYWLYDELHRIIYECDENGERYLKKYDPEEGAFSSYIYRVFRNTISNEYKKKGREAAKNNNPVIIPLYQEDEDGEEISEPFENELFKKYLEDIYCEDDISARKKIAADIMNGLSEDGDVLPAVFYRAFVNMGANSFELNDLEKLAVMKTFVRDLCLDEVVELKDLLKDSVRKENLFLKEDKGKAIIEIVKGNSLEAVVPVKDEEISKQIVELKRNYETVDKFDRFAEIIQETARSVVQRALDKNNPEDKKTKIDDYLRDFKKLLHQYKQKLIVNELKEKVEENLKKSGFAFRDFGHVFHDGFLNHGENLPQRNEIIAVAFTLGLDEVQLDELLMACGCSALYVRQPLDLVVKFALHRGWSLAQYLEVCREINTLEMDPDEQDVFYKEKYKVRIKDIRAALKKFEDREIIKGKNHENKVQTITDRVSGELDALMDCEEATKESLFELMEQKKEDFTLIRQRTYRILMEALLAFLEKNEGMTKPVKKDFDDRTINAKKFVESVEAFCGVEFPSNNMETMLKYVWSYFYNKFNTPTKRYTFNLNRDAFLALMIFLKQHKNYDMKALCMELNEALVDSGYEALNQNLSYDRMILEVARKGYKRETDIDEDGAYRIFAKGFFSIQENYSDSQYAFLNEKTV